MLRNNQARAMFQVREQDMTTVTKVSKKQRMKVPEAYLALRFEFWRRSTTAVLASEGPRFGGKAQARHKDESEGVRLYEALIFKDALSMYRPSTTATNLPQMRVTTEARRE